MSAGFRMRKLIHDVVPPLYLKQAKRAWYEARISIGQTPSPAIFGLDKKINNIVRPDLKPGGVFIEAGGNDGLTQSNTYHLEKYFDWSGLLVEPVPWLASFAEKHRAAEIVRCALAGFEKSGSMLTIWENDLVSSAVAGRRASEYTIEAPICALSELLDERGLYEVDFFSLDVEGFEEDVLAGIDFDKHTFRHILVETRDLGNLPFPWERYREPVQLTHHDYMLSLI